jgi:hypothetical protein
MYAPGILGLSPRSGAQRGSSMRGFVIAAACVALVVTAVAPVHALTPPEDGAESKSAEFAIVPPWSEGSHTVECGYGCGIHAGTTRSGAVNDEYALDCDLALDESVHPVADGVVLYAAAGTEGASGEGWKPYGNLVYVKHGDSGYMSVYAHLDSIDVTAGQPVTTGRSRKRLRDDRR